jgi:DNA-binding CsgD family transcriptional regulator
MGEQDLVHRSGDGQLDLSGLSPREREVLDAALEGISARVIAARLSISEATVRSHLATIYGKLGVSGRVELLARLHHGPTASPSPVEVASRPFSARVRVALIRRRWWLGLAAALLLVLAGFLVWRPDLPPRTDLGTVVGLLDEGRLRNLDLRDTTLTVVEDNGDRLRVEGVSAAEFDPIFQEALARGAQGVTAGGDGNYLGQLVAALGVMVLPPVALLLFVILMVRIVRRPSSLGS